MNRAFALGIGLLALAAVPAAAADIPAAMPVKAPVLAPAAYNWTGFYIGGHVGGAWASKDWAQTASSLALALDRNDSPAKVTGFLGGAQAGFNWQTGMWVFGVEGDWSWTGRDGCSNHVVFTSYSGCSHVDWYATATGRVGVTFDNWLLYGKGGAAFSNENHVILFRGVTTTDQPTDTRFGWTVGAGAEYGFWNNWSAKLEYNYLSFRGGNDWHFNYFANPAGLGEDWRINEQVHIVKFGVNYRFGGGPVVARY